MKHLLLPCALALTLTSDAQIGARISYFNPLGELGFVMKKTVAPELTLLQDYHERISPRASLGFAILNPRLDTFPVTGFIHEDGIDKVLPGTQIFHWAVMAFFTMGVDWNILDRDPFFVYPGIDVIGGYLMESFDEHFPTVIESSEVTGFGLAGFRARLGARYVLDDTWALALEANRSGYLAWGLGFLAHWDLGLGVNYVW